MSGFDSYTSHMLQLLVLVVLLPVVLVFAKAMLDGAETAAEHEKAGRIGDDGLLKEEHR